MQNLMPYMGFDLQIEILNYKSDYVGIRYSTINGFYMIGDVHYFTYKGGSTGKSVSEFKPILRPLSDLTDEMAVKSGYKDENALRLMIISQNIPYIGMKNLFQHHYDIFGLIEKGLAIDINTLTPN